MSKHPWDQDWERVFADTNHRWQMALRRGEGAPFFRDWDSSGGMKAERCKWLEQDLPRYAGLTDQAIPALHETVEYARSLGIQVPESSDPNQLLVQLSNSWEPDFAWMHLQADGRYHLIGGVVCFPSSWALEEKVGRPMSEVHGPVPGLNDALGAKIETFFQKLEPGVVWLRDNVNYSRSGELNLHPALKRPRFDSSVTVDEFWIRMEHQLLLKLPKSESILFGIRVNLIPITHFRDKPEAANRLARFLTTMTEEAATYKGLAPARQKLIAILREMVAAS